MTSGSFPPVANRSRISCWKAIFGGAGLLVLAVAPASLKAQTLYWDTNGSTPGAGNPADGIWSTSDANWSVSTDGDVATEGFTAGRDVVFSAGNDAATATVTMAGNQSAPSLTFRQGVVEISGGTVQTINAITVDSGVTASIENGNFTTGTTLSVDGEFSAGTFTGGSTMAKSGTGTASFASLDAFLTVNAGTFRMTGGNKLKNTTINSGGTLELAGSNVLDDGRNVTVNAGGTLDVAAGVTDNMASLSGAGDLTSGAGSELTISGGTFSGDISGGISFVKDGAGTHTFSGESSSSGNITVSDGIFSLSDNAVLTFYLGADGVNNQIGGVGTVNLNGDFVFDLSGAATAGSWEIVDVLSLTAAFGSTFSVQGWADAGSDIWEFDAGGGVTYSFNELTGVVTSVPEPGTTVLLGMGLALVLWRSGRRSRC